MKGLYACAASCALVAACGVDHASEPAGTSTVESPDHGVVPEWGSGSGSGSGMRCPVGAATFTRAMGLSDERQVLDLAVDPMGNVAFAAGPAASAGELTGVVGLTPSGDVRFTLPFGSVVATDASGNVYVAGAFTVPIDLGLGEIQPQGNIDVLVVKLDVHGHVLFAKALGLCGDGVQSIAVDTSGRIAISGSAMGTVVLSPAGDIGLQLAFSGDLAFDSHGNLVVYGAVAGSSDLFITKVDPAGRQLFSFVLPSNDAVATSVAVGPSDEIVFVGYTFGVIDLFGTRIVAMGAGENGRVTGAFAVKLDASGRDVFVRDLGIVEANGVAVDATSRIAINGALTGGAGFLRRLVVLTLDPRGVPAARIDEFVASGYGRGFAVGFDACGSIYAALVALDTPSRFSPLRSYVVKLEL